jgi:hypothetical protein
VQPLQRLPRLSIFFQVVACSTVDDMLDDEIRRYAKVLEAAVKLSEVSTRELERRLGFGGGTLNRIFAGKIDLKMRHILLVLDTLGMPPERFFQIACVRPPAAAQGGQAGSSVTADLLESFQRFGYGIGSPATPAATPVSDEGLDRRVEAALVRVLERFAAREPGGTQAGVHEALR